MNLESSYSNDSSSGDDSWDDDYNVYILPVLETLAGWNLEECIEEIIYLIFHEDCEEIRSNKGLCGFSTMHLAEWISRRSFIPHQEKQLLMQNIIDEGIDGDIFMHYILNERFEMLLPFSTSSSLSLRSRLLFGLLVVYWSLDLSFSLTTPINHVPYGVREGFISDLRHVHKDVAEEMIRVNKQAATTGEGFVYGQLIVLGHSEYRLFEGSWLPYGPANQKFVLYRRKIANGIRISSCDTTESDSLEYPMMMDDLDDDNGHTIGVSNNFAYFIDPLFDRFQLGRALQSTNDFVIPGPLHMNEDGQYTGPISRWACRIECERLPPYRAFIYAGGFDDQQRLSVGLRIDDETNIDGLAQFGVHIRQPEWDRWVEISAQGFPYTTATSPHIRHAHKWNRQRCESPLGNCLTDGTLIDIGGVILMYQSPISMARCVQQMQNPQQIINYWQAQRPHCPVQFHAIHVSYTDPDTRKLRAVQRIYEEDHFKQSQSALVVGDTTEKSVENIRYSVLYGDYLHPMYTPVHIPTVDFSLIPVEHRPYVYPSCGHVFAYHSMLDTARPKQCPLCRTVGVFVPMAFTYEPCLDTLSQWSRHSSRTIAAPTHVFNPCGHVASIETVRKWATIPLPLARHQHHSPINLSYNSRSHPENRSSASNRVTPSRAINRSATAEPRVRSVSNSQHIANQMRRSGNEEGEEALDSDEDDNFHAEEFYCHRGICPFCAQPLHPSRPFAKLVIQFDTCGNESVDSQDSVDNYCSPIPCKTEASKRDTLDEVLCQWEMEDLQHPDRYLQALLQCQRYLFRSWHASTESRTIRMLSSLNSSRNSSKRLHSVSSTDTSESSSLSASALSIMPDSDSSELIQSEDYAMDHSLIDLDSSPCEAPAYEWYRSYPVYAPQVLNTL